MGKLTFRGGIHPYEGKELSIRLRSISQKEIWFIHSLSTSEHHLFPA